MSVNFKYLINSSKQGIYSRHFMKKIILIFFIFLASSAGYAQITPDAGRILNQENDRQKSKEIPKQIPKSLLEKSKKKKLSHLRKKHLLNLSNLKGTSKHSKFQIYRIYY